MDTIRPEEFAAGLVTLRLRSALSRTNSKALALLRGHFRTPLPGVP